MDTVTYPHPEVAAELDGHFACFKANLTERHPDFAEASGGGPVPWAPTFVLTDARGRQVRRSVGWLPPSDFLAELRTARGIWAITRRRTEDAEALLAAVVDDHPRSPAAPEAAYWLGVSRFLAGRRDIQALADAWHDLRRRFPGSEWALKAEVIEDWKGGPI